MHIQSPLSNLRDVLAQVRSSAASYKDTLKNNEAATRAVLIDPVLRALGWDTSNTYMVEVEKTLNQTRADYALYENGSGVKIIIEAKKLGDSLSQHDIKLVNYAFTFQLGSIFLTDGVVWLHYTSFQPTHFAPTKVLNIAQDDLGEAAAYFVQHLDAALLWPEDQTVDTLSQQIAQLQSDMATVQQELVARKTQQAIPAPTPVVLPPPPLPPLLEGEWVSLDTLHAGANLKLKRLRLPDGEEVPISQWKQMLVEICKFVLAANPQMPVPLPDRTGRKVSLLSAEPFPNNISHLSLPLNGKTVYLYTNYDANNCISNARHILKHLPQIEQKVAPAVVVSEG